MDVVEPAGRAVVAVAFGWAATGKLLDLPGLRATLYLSRVTRPFVPQLTVLLPLTELVLGGGLIEGPSAWPAVPASALLLAAFVGYLALDERAGEGCDCFGRARARRRPVGRAEAIGRDVVLVACLVPALLAGPDGGSGGVPEGLRLPYRVGATVVILALVTWAFVRERRSRRSGRQGRSGRRRAGVPPSVTTRGEPAVGRRPAPGFDLATLAGGRVTPSGPVILVFTEPGCAQCEELAPALAGRPDVLVLAAGRPAEVAAWAARHGLAPQAVALDPNGATADAYGLTAVPAAWPLDADGLLATPRPRIGTPQITKTLGPPPPHDPPPPPPVIMQNPRDHAEPP